MNQYGNEFQIRGCIWCSDFNMEKTQKVNSGKVSARVLLKVRSRHSMVKLREALEKPVTMVGRMVQTCVFIQYQSEIRDVTFWTTGTGCLHV